MTNLERYEAMDANQLIIQLDDLASSAEREVIFAMIPQLRPDYDLEQNPKTALRKSIEKSLEIMLEMMVLLLVLDQKEGGCVMQGAGELVAESASRVQNSTQKLLNLYKNSK
ncbi:hypothetical protein UFOVP571_32 [uncultured Caudovirales phage]|uniref:Uncharacterized protein n=1 Tax=uncultured Caudovirales phage TaxID=2100421 RepID=A0A6J5MU17_9CAUD|nr:hypothetical protein UFOVP571_32 [uncultured Caudovirales phage]